MTEGRRTSGAVDANMSEMSTSEALLVHMQGEDCGVGMTLSLATFKGILTFIYDTLLFSTLLIKYGVRDGLTLLLNGGAVAVDMHV